MADRVRVVLDGGFAAAARCAADRGLVPVGYVGDDLPLAMLRAAGLMPLRLRARMDRPTPFAAARGLSTAMGRPARALLEAIADARPHVGAILMSHPDAVTPQVFASLRALPELRLDETTVMLCDLPRIDRPSSRTYADTRLTELRRWCGTIGVPVEEPALLREMAVTRQLDELRRQLNRRCAQGGIGASVAFETLSACDRMPADAQRSLLRDVLADPAPAVAAGPNLLLTGSPDQPDWVYRQVDAAGAGLCCAAWLPTMLPATGDSLADLRTAAMGWQGGAFAGLDGLRARIASLAALAAPDAIVHAVWREDEAARWATDAVRVWAANRDVPFLEILLDAPDAAVTLADFAGRPTLSGTASVPAAAPARTPARPAVPPERSRKTLASTADFNAFQRQWFAELRARAAEGGAFAVVNANSPQEILRALDIPYVVNQWWASIVAAKQQSRRYAALLRADGNPADAEAYSAQGVAALLDDGEDAPWGGLPRPTMLHAVADSDATRNLFDRWAERSGASLYMFERSIESRWALPVEWWRLLPEQWDETLESARLDLMEAELHATVARLESETGRRFDPARFASVMDLVNEQEQLYRETRDMIARARPAPVGIADTMPATMVPQWHRGSVWGRDAARAFRDEVAARIAAGAGACRQERIRLMWVGRGLWSDMGFYQRWEQSHGAVFVCSMYLSLAADGYIRETRAGQDPMRALAARFVTMGDELRMPSWAGPWHVHEARQHGVHAAIAIDDADPFVLRALEAAGIPVLRLDMGNYAQGGSDRGAAAITTFLDALVAG